MPEAPLSDIQCFDPNQDHTIAYGRLPHWAQAGTVCFITWRTADSLPKEAIARLNRQRQELLKQHQLDPNGDWKRVMGKLPPKLRWQLHWAFYTTWDEQLDLAAGACVLREPDLSLIVMNSLLHFDNDRYVLTDAVIMPNHVHLLVAFRDEDSLMTQCRSWKQFTATRINKWLRERASGDEQNEENVSRGATDLRSSVVPQPRFSPPPGGEFWQVDQFDHLVRSPEDFDKYRRYIADNPRKAGLPEGSYRYFTKVL